MVRIFSMLLRLWFSTIIYKKGPAKWPTFVCRRGLACSKGWATNELTQTRTKIRGEISAYDT